MRNVNISVGGQLLEIKRLLWYSSYARDFPAQVWIHANVMVECEIPTETGQTATCHQEVSEFDVDIRITW